MKILLGIAAGLAGFLAVLLLLLGITGRWKVFFHKQENTGTEIKEEYILVDDENLKFFIVQMGENEQQEYEWTVCIQNRSDQSMDCMLYDIQIDGENTENTWKKTVKAGESEKATIALGKKKREEKKEESVKVVTDIEVTKTDRPETPILKKKVAVYPEKGQGMVVEEIEESIFRNLPETFAYRSEDEDMYIELYLKEDGSFDGVYYSEDDSNWEEDWTFQIEKSEFNGRFEIQEKEDECTYDLQIKDFKLKGREGDTYQKGSGEYVYTAPELLTDQDEFIFYLPGKNLEDIPDALSEQLDESDGEDTLETNVYGLYDLDSDIGFIGRHDDQTKGWKKYDMGKWTVDIRIPESMRECTVTYWKGSDQSYVDIRYHSCPVGKIYMMDKNYYDTNLADLEYISCLKTFDTEGKKILFIQYTTKESSAFLMESEWPSTEEVKERYLKILDTVEEWIEEDIRIGKTEKEEKTDGKKEKKNQDSEKKFFSKLPDTFTFSSGGGGWATEIYIAADGSFTGHYQDYDSGSSSGVYDWTAYINNFSGRFTDLKKIDEYTYSAKVDDFRTEGREGDSYAEGDTEYFYTEPYGFSDPDEILIYLPGKRIDEISGGFLTMILDGDPDGYLNEGCYGLLNVKEDIGFYAQVN